VALVQCLKFPLFSSVSSHSLSSLSPFILPHAKTEF
jgi:hypothetical protein